MMHSSHKFTKNRINDDLIKFKLVKTISAAEAGSTVEGVQDLSKLERGGRGVGKIKKKRE